MRAETLMMLPARLTRRSLLWILAVTVIGFTAMLVLQFQLLKKLERTTALAQHDQVQNAVGVVSNQVERFYLSNSLRALSVDPQADNAKLGAHFAATSFTTARRFFVSDLQAQHIRFFDAHGKDVRPRADELQAATRAIAGWALTPATVITQQSALLPDARDPMNRVITHPLHDSTGSITSVAGLIVDTNQSREMIGGMLHRRATALFPVDENGVTVSAIFDTATGKTLFATEKLRNDHEIVRASLPFLFTDWQLGLQNICWTPEELAACTFHFHAMWTGGVALLLVASLILAVRSAARELRLSQMKSDFVSNVSHELRTPLSSIRVFGEYMAMGRVTDPAKVQEYGTYIERESSRLTQLIDNILDFSRIESGRKKYQFEEMELVPMLRSLIDTFATPLTASGVRISLAAPVHVPKIQGDAQALWQVLTNLLDNAVKYSRDDKRIDVVVKNNGNEVTIAVRDRGIGIAAADQKKVFEKFFRAGSSLVHDVKGSGLGLAIVQHVVQAHGGRVCCSSTAEEGTTFTITLPAICGDQESSLLGTRSAEVKA